MKSSWPIGWFPALLKRRRFQSRTAPIIRNKKATPPTTPPTIAPTLTEEFFFSVEDASGVELDRVTGVEDDATVKAGIPGETEKVTEEAEKAVDEAADDDSDVEEVVDFCVLVADEVVGEEELCKEIGFIRSADPLTRKSPRFCLQHVSPMVPFPQQKLPSLHGVTVNVAVVRSISFPTWYCPMNPRPVKD